MPISRISTVILGITSGPTAAVVTRAATGIDTANPLMPATLSPTRWVNRMYPAQQTAAPSAYSTPATSTAPSHGRVSSATPSAASPGQTIRSRPLP